MAKRMTLMIVFLTLVFGGLVGFYFFKKQMIAKYMSGFAPPPVTVTASIAQQESWQPNIPAVGNLVAVNGVEVSSQVSGIVESIDFHSGSYVKAGTPLVALDTHIEMADLRSLAAQLKLAELSYKRINNLVDRNAASQADRDQASAKLEEAKAAVLRTQELINQKNIKAPFDGKLGIRQADLGQFVSPGQNLVTLQSLDPLYVQFNLPEQDITLISTDQPIVVDVQTEAGILTVNGKIHAFDAKANLNTRMFTVEGTIPNPDHKLLPGMSSDVKVMLPTQQQVVTVPETAIDYSLYGDSVYVIDEGDKADDGSPSLTVTRRYVKVGDRKDNKAAVLDGLKQGEQVVTSGQLKLHNGTHVLIDNKVTTQ